MGEFKYDNPSEFLSKYNTLIDDGVDKEHISLYYPHPVHGLDEAIDPRPSYLRYFTLIGAITGLILGFAFPIYTVYSWPLVTGGKPLISIPAFIIIAFELTILIGAIVSFIGFLLLAGLPSFKNISEPKEFGNEFVIIVSEKGQI